MKDIVIIYHADCPDGFGGAWAAWKKFGDKAEYIPGSYNNTVIEGLRGKEIYFIDFMYPDEVVRDLIKNNKRVTAIDHHFSKEAIVKTTEDYSYSVDNSGSVLAWKYFHSEPVPKLLSYIEDRDLYRFDLPHSRAICIFIDSFDRDFEVWDKLVKDIGNEDKFKNAVERGDIIIKYEEEFIKKTIEENAKLVVFEGYEVYAANASHIFASDIGNILCHQKPPFSVVWSEDKEMVRVSLRSDRDGSFDVSKIAAKFGGGGHKSAAGFRLPSTSAFPWKNKDKN